MIEPTAPLPSPPVAPVGWLASSFAGLAVALVRALPARALRVLALFVGRLAYGLGIRRRVTLENLEHAFPERPLVERKRIAQAAYVNLALSMLEALSSVGQTDEELERLIDFENWAPVQQALSAGKGVLLATAHLGNWEMLGEGLARRGVKISAVVRPLKGALNARIVEARQHAGVGLILQRGAVAQMVAALGRGEVVAQLIDQALPSTKALFVPFFGRLASTTPGLAIAAARSGAPIFVVVAAREGERLRILAEGPVAPPTTGDPQRDLVEHTAMVSQAIERLIRRYPDQWLWLHRRWKVQPPAGAT